MKIGRWAPVVMMLLILSQLAQAEMIQSTKDGGVSGGGGGVNSPEPIDLDFIRSTLPYVRAAVMGALNSQEFYVFNVNHANAPEPGWHDVFKESPTIHEVIESAQIELKVSGPCRDANGNAVDGSIHGVAPGNICLSADAFIAKSNSVLFFQDAGALIIHELSHLAGADEVMATTLQKNTYPDLGKYIIGVGQFWGSVFVDELKNQLRSYQESMGRISEASNACVRMKYMNVMLNNVRMQIWINESPLTVLRGEEHAHFNANLLRSGILEEYFCGQDTSESRLTNLRSQHVLELGFAGDPSVDLATFVERMNTEYEQTGTRYFYEYPEQPEIMAKPTSVDTALLGLNKVYTYLSNNYNHIASVTDRLFSVVEN